MALRLESPCMVLKQTFMSALKMRDILSDHYTFCECKTYHGLHI